MPYDKQSWRNGPFGATPLQDVRLNHVEAGMQGVANTLDQMVDAVNALIAGKSGIGATSIAGGTTANRPAPILDAIYRDHDLNRVIYGTGSGWVFGDGTAVSGVSSSNAPQNFTAITQPNNSIICAWNPVTNATSYKLYETASPSGVSGATALTTTTSTRTPSTLRTYEYWATATVGGVESAASNHGVCVLPYSAATGGPPVTSDAIQYTYFEEMAYELTSTAENSRKDWYSTAVYGYIQDIHDNRGYTAGIVGFCSGTGDMLAMIQHYVAIKPTSNAMATYVSALTTLAGEGINANAGTRAASLLGTTFTNLWTSLATSDALFRQAQRDYREDHYWRPAYNAAVSDGVRGLGLAILYDISVNHGEGTDPQSFGGIIAAARATSRPPSLGGTEVGYLTALIDTRSAVLTAWGDNPSNGRVAAHRALLATGNYTLAVPFSWTMYGTGFSLATRPDLPAEAARVGGIQPGASVTPDVPVYDHIVIAIFENHDSSEVNSSSAPYLWSLAQGGARLSNSFGILHPSEGNYVALFSGSTYGLENDTGGNPGLTNASIWSQLGSGNNCRWYSEGKPSDPHSGSSGAWTQWHVGMAYFAGTDSQDLAWSAFPSDYTQLPKVAFISPDNNHNMHDTDVPTGNAWASSNLNAYAQWAQTHNSLLIITFDESQQSNPTNDIFTVFYGAHVPAGTIVTRHVDHYDVLRTVEAANGLPGIANAATRSPIVEAFTAASGNPTTGGSPAALLHIGTTGGFWNEGIGLSSGHVDYPYSDLVAGKTWPPYFQLNTAQNAVQFLVYMNGGTTSANTNYPRSELRELGHDGVTKAAWVASSGSHVMEYSFKVNHVQPNKPWVTVGQIHDASNDNLGIKVKGSTTSSLSIIASINGTDNATPVLSSYAIGQTVKIKVDLTNGSLKIYANDTLKITSSALSSAGAGHYFKLGAYAQSAVNFGGFESASEYSSVDIWGLTVTHSPAL